MNIQHALTGSLIHIFKTEPELKEVARKALEGEKDISLNRTIIQEFVRENFGTQVKFSIITFDGYVTEITVYGHGTITQTDINSATREALELLTRT